MPEPTSSSDSWTSEIQRAALPSGRVYAYVHRRGSRGTSLLFLHGFPETAHDWRAQVDHFSSLGYGVIAPDLLGYGMSAAPPDHTKYRMRLMADDIAALLNHVEIDQAVAVGHDWGSSLLSRLAVYHRDKLAGVVFLASGVLPYGPMHVDLMNDMTRQQTGQEAFGYIQFLTADPDAPALLERDPRVTTSLFFGAGDEHWQRYMGRLGATRRYLEAGRKGVVAAWMDLEVQDYRERSFARSGYHGACNWYKQATDRTLNAADEEGLSDGEKRISDWPVRLVLGRQQGEQTMHMMEAMTRAFVPDLQVSRIDAGHFMMLEAPDQVNREIECLLASLARC